MSTESGDPLAFAFAALSAGDPAHALAAAQAAVAALPNDPRAWALQARAALGANQPELAQTAINAALVLDPASVPALIECAALARRKSDAALALASFAQLTQAAPQHAPFWADLATLAEQGGEIERAETAWNEALARAPNERGFRMGRAALYFRQARFGQALDDTDAALELSPNDVAALTLGGECLISLDRAREAATRLERSVSLAPRSWVVHDALLRALKTGGAAPARQLAQAERLADVLGGAFGQAVYAVEQMVQGGAEAGAERIAKAYAMDPTQPMALWLSMQVPPSIVHDDAAAEAAFLAQWRRRLAELEALDLSAVNQTLAQSILFGASNFFIHYLGEPLTDDLGRLGRIIQALAERAAGARTPLAKRTEDGRLRVGLVSGMWRHHTVTKLFGEMVRGLDRERIETSLFYAESSHDQVTQGFIDNADAFIVLTRSLQSQADAVRARQLDLLVYLDVGMTTTSNALAALRLAPVQAMLWGHPVTSGLPNMDVFLSSAAMEPADGASHYTETLHLLPGLGTCYQLPQREPEVPKELATRERHQPLAFMPQLVHKIGPAFDTALARIAAKAPQLRFAFTPYSIPVPITRWRQRLGVAFLAAGVNLDQRIALCRWLSQSEWLGVAREADFALDSFRWSGGNTSLEMFAFDTPIVTLPGSLMRSRHTAAMLTLMEIPELIARDADDYVEIAVRLAGDVEFRSLMRERIGARKQRLYNDRRVVDAFTAFVTEQAQRGRCQRLAEPEIEG